MIGNCVLYHVVFVWEYVEETEILKQRSKLFLNGAGHNVHALQLLSDSIDALERRASVRKAICGIKSRSSEDDEMNSLLKERGSVRNALHMADEYLGFLPSV